MSVTSVGASFGYVNPGAVSGATSRAVADSDAAGADSVSTPTSEPAAKPDSEPSRTSEPATPRFAPSTGAALLAVQEKAQTPAAAHGSVTSSPRPASSTSTDL